MSQLKLCVVQHSMSTTPTPSPASTHPETMDEDQLQQGIWMLCNFSLILYDYGINSILQRCPPPPELYTHKYTSEDMPILCRTISYIAKEFKIEDKSREICAKVRKKMIKILKNRSLTCECMVQELPQSQKASVYCFFINSTKKSLSYIFSSITCLW